MYMCVQMRACCVCVCHAHAAWWPEPPILLLLLLLTLLLSCSRPWTRYMVSCLWSLYHQWREPPRHDVVYFPLWHSTFFLFLSFV
jgi:hypothetical protein